MELETDKAVIEVPSSVSGVVSEIRVKEGDKLKVGQVIFTVENGAGGRSPRPQKPKLLPSVTRLRKNQTRERQASPPARTSKTSINSKAAPAPPSTERRARTIRPARGRSLRIQASRTRREHRSRRPRPPDDHARRESLRRPAGDGTRNRQGRRRSAFVGQRRGERNQVKEGDKVKVGQVIFTLEGGAQPQAGESRVRTGRACFRTAGRSPGISSRHEGRGQDRRAGPASRSPACRRRPPSPCRCNSGKSRAPSIAIPSRRRRMCVAWRANSGSTSTTSPARARRTHQRRRCEGVCQGDAGRRRLCRAGSASRAPRRTQASRLHQVGQGRTRLHARRAPQDRRASARSLGHDSARHAARPRRHHRTRAAARQVCARAPKKPAAR